MVSSNIIHPGAQGQPCLTHSLPGSWMHCQLLWCHILAQHCDIAPAITQPRTDGCRVAAGPVQLPREPVHRDAVHLRGICRDRVD